MKAEQIENYIRGLSYLYDTFYVLESLDHTYGCALFKLKMDIKEARLIEKQMKEWGWELSENRYDDRSVMWKYDTK